MEVRVRCLLKPMVLGLGFFLIRKKIFCTNTKFILTGAKGASTNAPDNFAPAPNEQILFTPAPTAPPLKSKSTRGNTTYIIHS